MFIQLFPPCTRGLVNSSFFTLEALVNTDQKICSYTDHGWQPHTRVHRRSLHQGGTPSHHEHIRCACCRGHPFAYGRCVLQTGKASYMLTMTSFADIVFCRLRKRTNRICAGQRPRPDKIRMILSVRAWKRCEA